MKNKKKMSSLWAWHLVCILLWLAMQNLVKHASSQYPESLESSTMDKVQRHRRAEDLYSYNSKYVYLCAVGIPYEYEFELACEITMKCKLAYYKINEDRETAGNLPEMDDLTENCPQVYNSLKYLNVTQQVPKTEIRQLVFDHVNVTRIRPDYFCEMSNITVLQLVYNTVWDSRDFGFGDHCDISNKTMCCACQLRHLNLERNSLQVVGNASFCRLPHLHIIDLSSNRISKIHEKAFANHAQLQMLNLQNNELKVLSANILQPLHRLDTLNLGNNHLTNEVLLALQYVSNLKQLNLQFNNITGLDNGTFSAIPPSLVELVLMGNHISSLTVAFQTFHQLQKLDVSHNNISEVSVDFFTLMPRLEEINLGRNRLHHLPTGLFSMNNYIKEVNLESNILTSIPALNASSLNTLSLSNNRIKNITSTDRVHLCQLSDLKVLMLKNNGMTTIVPHAFDCNYPQNLSLVDLEHNLIESIVDVFDKSRIVSLNLRKNHLRTFSFDNFSDDILELSFGENAITAFISDPKVVNRSMALKKLDLSKNHLSNLTAVALPPNLEKLNLEHNQITVFSFVKLGLNNSYVISPKLQEVSLKRNQLTNFCPMTVWLATEGAKVRFMLQNNPFECVCEVAWLRKYYGKEIFIYKRSSTSCKSQPETTDLISAFVNASPLYQVAQFTCNTVSTKVNCQCNLISTYSAGCGMPCPTSCTCYINSNFTMYLINCSGRQFHDIVQEYVHPKFSVVLDFSKNLITVLNSWMFVSYRNVRKLSVKSNKLTNITHDAFWQLANLEVLDLEDNLLKELPYDVFANSPQMTELYLAKNRLVYLSDDLFEPLISLRVLQLQKNSLTSFPVWRFEELVTLSSVQLSYNPWSCDCDYLEKFRNWLQYFTHKVTDVDDVYCTESDGDSRSAYPILSYNLSHCYTDSVVIVSGNVTVVWSSVMSVMTFLVVVSVLLFLYRREMQVLIYSRYGVRFFQHNKEADVYKKYDAFIAYSSHDLEFVACHLVPGLEKIEKPYTVCIHDRDFLVGAIINDSILAAIENSRRTIVILSKHFVASGWCIFEFKSAHTQMLTDRCSRIIVVMLDDIPQNIDPEIKAYLRTNTYLKWGDKLFWQKLYYALPDRTDVQPTTLELNKIAHATSLEVGR